MVKRQISAQDDAGSIEGEAVETSAKTVMPEPGETGAQPVARPPVFLIASTALILAILAIGLSGFALWRQASTDVVLAAETGDTASLTPKALTGDKASSDTQNSAANARINALITKQIRTKFDQALDDQMVTLEMQKKALSDILARLKLLEDVLPEATVEGGAAPSSDRETVDQRFAALELALDRLKTQAQADLASPEGGDARGVSRSSFAPLAASGLLAANLAGQPLDRWIAALQKMVESGISFDGFDQLKSAAAKQPLAAPQLLRNANDLVPIMAASLTAADVDAGLLERAGARLAQIVKLRALSADAGGNQGVLRRFEMALIQQDLAGAHAAAALWDGDMPAALDSWLAAAAARLQLDRIVTDLVARLLAGSLGAQ
jgi:hypothetical protein